MRERSNNRVGLQRALRGVLQAGGNHEKDWPIRRVLAVGDKATGLAVLVELYDSMRETPVSPDLDRLFGDLGVTAGSGQAVLDNNAPLAAIRRAIVAPPVAHRRSDQRNCLRKTPSALISRASRSFPTPLEA